MSLPANISDLLIQRLAKSTRIEYKAIWNPEPILHSIRAFASGIDNCGSRYKVLGIEEKAKHTATACRLPQTLG